MLSTENLTIKHGLCRHLNWKINPGDIWGILGPNGSGKTTLLHSLAGLIPSEAGDIILGNKPLSTQSPKSIAKQLGLLLQDTTIYFPQSVFEFCLSGRYPHQNRLGGDSREDKAITLNALTTMELDKKSAQNSMTLSGGEKRRLGIATLLSQAPDVYLLDEPTNHLDLRHQMRVLNHFQTLANQHGASVIMSLHDVNLAAHYCNKIILLWGDGNYLLGDVTDMITQENITRLYQIPYFI